jgi:hypothetical protein
MDNIGTRYISPPLSLSISLSLYTIFCACGRCVNETIALECKDDPLQEHIWMFSFSLNA